MEGLFDELRFYFERGGFVMAPLCAGAVLLWYGLGYRMMTLRSALFDQARSAALAVVDCPSELRRDLLDEALTPFERETERFAVLVGIITAVAPLAGLLGTVSGMIETFASLQDMALFTQSGGIAGGISQALFSTQMGLAVAIPGLLVGRMLSRREALFKDRLEALKVGLCAEPRAEVA